MSVEKTVPIDQLARRLAKPPPKPPCLDGTAHHWRVTTIAHGVQQHFCERCGATWVVPMASETRQWPHRPTREVLGG
jgi:hypothetical protein